MNICVFCSANDLEDKYTIPSVKLVKLLAGEGHTIVWGGSRRGLMGKIADSAQTNGGKIVGVTIEYLKSRAHTNADEMIITKNVSERKSKLLAHADVIVVLVGGLGTIDELTEVLELKREGIHNKPIVILNTDGFYDGLKMQFERIAREGFLPANEQLHVSARPLQDYLTFIDMPEAVLEYIHNVPVYRPAVVTV